ncbi:MAG: T9SS type A sorting domain-containing protein, partial [Bacteroidales bacterium]|nr:T9SS type A sorting domain-containing protein [Bacteroidales bacterium]
FKDYPNLYLKPNSLNETVSKNDYAIYPNPALEGEQVWINHYSSIIESFEIYDITGKAIRGAIEKVTGNKITISGLSPGIYMIKVNNHISKLVVN